jgi:hypothetical protein
MGMCLAEKELRIRANGTGPGRETHLPPAILIKLIFLDNFYALASTEGDLVFVLRGKVMSGINIFDHLESDGEGREQVRVMGWGVTHWNG